MSTTQGSIEPWQTDMCSRLDKLRLAWRNVDSCPDEVGVLSGGEYRSLVLACGHEKLLSSPVADFLLLDGWLQQWVLRCRGMSHLIGTKVGFDPDWVATIGSLGSSSEAPAASA